MILGRRGGWFRKKGLENKVLATVHPAGKAMGVGGAWICGDTLLKDYLINYSRPMIFSTAPTPLIPILLRHAVKHWKENGPERVGDLRTRIDFFNSRCRAAKTVDQSPIIPISIGDNRVALSVSEELLRNGFDVRAIRPPTVPEGTARLRLTMKCNHTLENLERLSSLLAKWKSK